jgi:hypothetical protein
MRGEMVIEDSSERGKLVPLRAGFVPGYGEDLMFSLPAIKD